MENVLLFIILVHVGILLSGKLFLTAESLGTIAVAIKSVLCTSLKHEKVYKFRFRVIFQRLCENDQSERSFLFYLKFFLHGWSVLVPRQHCMNLIKS